ncbi:membrane integrity-associated transporter subunit PqiC [Cupriavidus pauculus]|uniref:Membrane integrity-associated transporter subunit PqiC n=2 Tax=Burkholderiaceae TaxID=119060 RepID=A0A5P2H569_9BURK|nr:PqiC family protein [Cupriavidus pauculus]QET02645.1 membrane integrity-associated transporter subunit PqiC [Cupriavidus pauculus]
MMIQRSLTVPRAGRRLAAPMVAALALLLAACASPDPRYYSLAASAANAVPAAPPARAEPLWIEVAPVRVPERLNRAQLVVGDGADGQLKLLDLSRWSSPLPDEMRDALSQQLQARLGAVDVYQQGLSDVAPVYRITTEVVRMDGDVGQRANATIAWTVRRLPDGRVTGGRTVAEVAAPGQVEGLVGAYRQIVGTTADDIAAALSGLKP